MKIFRKDKEKEKEKDKDKGERLDGSQGVPREQVSIRTRTSTSSPLLQSSTTLKKDSSDGSSNGNAGSLGRSSQTPDAKKQHAIRIGDTRFYGRIICRAKALYVLCFVLSHHLRLHYYKKGMIIHLMATPCKLRMKK